MCLSSKASGHFYGIGDWGGDTPGGTWVNPGHQSYHGGFMAGPDDHGQYYVARQMKDLASQPEKEPDYVLNVGDNFYPGGYNDHCGSNQATNDDPIGQFQSTVDEIYGGPGMTGKPWLGVLGNHDFGGISMGMGWDQMIFHSWHNDNWRTPGTHWSQRVQYQDFAVQFIFLDSNWQDAGVDPGHDICQTFNGDVPFCSDWGINSHEDCVNWFQEQWHGGIQMAEDILKDSTAEWHVLVTHYPYVVEDENIMRLRREYGIDMYVAGHDHTQLLAQQDEDGMVLITTGGGGGITSDCGAIDPAQGNDDALGFVDFEINRTSLTINMMTWGGCTSCDGTEGPVDQVIRNTMTISPHGSRPSNTSRSVEQRADSFVIVN
jgi:predicted phosphodiesterase